MFVDRHQPPYKAAGAVILVLAAIAASLVYLQFRGDLTPKTHLTVLSPRAGLVADPGSKVTYNGVVIGKVAGVDYVDVGGSAKAKPYSGHLPVSVHCGAERAGSVFPGICPLY